MQNDGTSDCTSAELNAERTQEVLDFVAVRKSKLNSIKVSNKMRLQGMKMVSASSISDPIIQLIACLAGAGVCPLYARASQA